MNRLSISALLPIPALTMLLLTEIFLMPSVAQSRHHNGVTPLLAQQNSQNNESSDWSNYTDLQEQFISGCVGDQTDGSERQRYCECALEAYQSRYSPQLFVQIIAFAQNIGEQGSTLVNLMMEPELSECSATTNFKRS